MIDFQISWSTPYKIHDYKDGIEKWRRHWIIPPEHRSSFFNYWSRSKFQLWGEGFSITKQENDWVLLETKLCVENFKPFKGTPPPKPTEDPQVFWLPPYEVKDKSGLRPWQEKSVSKLVSSINKYRCGIDGSDLGCHAKGQLILMANGTLKKVEDIIEGDIICGWKSPQKVVRLHRGKQQMVKVIPIKGNPFIVNINHILTVVITNSPKTHKTTGGFRRGDVVDISIKDFLTLNKTTQNTMKLLFSSGIDYWKEKKYEISPYFVGSLLGDGGMSKKGVVTFTSNDKEVWEEIENEGKRFSWTFGKTNEDITKRITNSSNLFSWLRKNNLFPIKCEDRFIPFDYKTGGFNQRLQLLAGLIDTDGWCSKKCYCFTSKSYKLSEDVLFLAKSVGLAAYIKRTEKKCYTNGKVGVYWNVKISGNTNIIPCRIKRKIVEKRIIKKDALRRGFKIELLNEDEFFGFSLDGDGRFLLGDFTITHNTGKTYVSCAVARELNMKMVIICPKAVMESWKRVIINHFHMKDRLIDIINYEQLRIGKRESKVASFIENRKTHREKFTWKISKDTLIIWDESQKLKNWKTKNSKTCVEAFKQGYKMLFCSATNATNPLELRTVGTVLGLFKGATAYYRWCYEHGVSKGRFGLEFTKDMVVRQRILRKLHTDIFVNRGIRLSRDTIPNFPESEVIADCYNMDDEDVKKINSYHKEMETELKRLKAQMKVDKASELTAILRARQQIELQKVPLFIDMIEEGIEEGMSVVAFLNFTETIRAISKRLNTDCIFDGKVGDIVRQQNVDDFQNGKQRVILVNIQSGGAGLSLHDIHGKNPRLTLLSPSYSAVLMRQATGRVWRDSSKSKSVQKIVFVAGTVEETVCENVQEKLKNLDLLNDGDLKIENEIVINEHRNL